jgi:flagellar biosynthetic protein FlhB
MPENNGQERTEQATPKKRLESRKKGQVAQSKEISSVLILITSLGIFFFAGSWIFWNLSEFFTGFYQNIGTLRLNNASDASALFFELYKKGLTILLPILLPILLAGLVANIAQVGFEIHSEAIGFKFSKLNPISGMKKFVSLKSLVELAKSIAKILLIGGVAGLVIKGEMQHFPALIHQEVGQILVFISKIAFKIFFYVSLVLIILAVVDYVYQRWQFEEDLKMTKQEVKDERKQTEGDPKVKARIRSIQMEMAQRRMMEAVPEADVVITNPTHLAIAIKFDAQSMVAPTILAKGAGFVAEQIKEIATENRVPLVEDKPLAQTLYKMVEVGDFIPLELYRAVAEILAYVYRLKGGYAMA